MKPCYIVPFLLFLYRRPVRPWCTSVINPTILLEAAYEGLEQLKKLELDRILGDGLPTILGNTEDEEGRHALHYAAAGGRVDVLEYLIEEIKLDINVQDNAGGTPLFLAATAGRVSTVGYLLKMGANPDQPNNINEHPLHHAAKNGHNGVIIVLHSNGVNIDVSNDFGSPLRYACAFGQHDTVKLLLCLNAN
ncbi:hypothetical protein MKW94_001496, partial [Papaver nudicaule]|nr:hypothetical protein [Papaver nudicaule]